MLWFVLLVIGFISSDNVFVASAKDDTLLVKNIENGIFGLSTNLEASLRQDSTPGKNILFSPLNLYTALALVHFGSDGITQQELAKLMGLPKDNTLVKSTHLTFSKIIKDIQNSSHATVEFANGLFVQKEFLLKDSYKEVVHGLYNGTVQNVDFQYDPYNAVQTVNTWITNKTKGRIAKLFEEPFDRDTVVVLASTLYFSGNWKHKFKTHRTKYDKFKTYDNQELDVLLMNQEEKFAYSKNPTLQYEAVSIPYDGDEFSMFVILPYNTSSVEALAKELTAPDLQHLIQHTEEKHLVDLKLPKMKFNWKQEISQHLQKLGAHTLFDKANLTNMMYANNVDVSKVTHATEIEVHESGTVATAVTVVEMVARSGGHRSSKHEVIHFYVTRPFMFFIYHHKTSTILFTGLVYKP